MVSMTVLLLERDMKKCYGIIFFSSLPITLPTIFSNRNRIPHTTRYRSDNIWIKSFQTGGWGWEDWFRRLHSPLKWTMSFLCLRLRKWSSTLRAIPEYSWLQDKRSSSYCQYYDRHALNGVRNTRKQTFVVSSEKWWLFWKFIKSVKIYY